MVLDSTGNVYVADASNNRIQGFTAEGKFLWKFGKHGSGTGELNFPSSVSLFTSEGKFLPSFGMQGSALAQLNTPRGVMVWIC